ncbi:hypothetical protein GCM10020216_039950 [Nonomuraea helvata]
MIRVEAIAASDEQPELVPAYRIGSSYVVDTAMLGCGEFKKRRSKVNDMHGTPHVISEQHPSRPAGGQ